MKRRRLTILLLVGILLSPVADRCIFHHSGVALSAKVKTTKAKSGAAKKTSASNKKASAPKKKSGGGVIVEWRDTVTGEWIHRAKRNIVVYRDSTGIVRAMSPYKASASTGRRYAEALNEYADSLKPFGCRVYSLIGPTQGEFYMPPQITDNVSQAKVIEEVAEFFSDDVTPIFVSENLAAHCDEVIYNYTDHHWAPLGAFYAAEVLADRLGMKFLPLEAYTPDTVRNYVGSMYNFSGDPAVKNSPEIFVFYRSPGDYFAEFIDYKVVNNETRGESEKHEGKIYRKFPDGSGSAYSTFLGGDSHTVRIVNRNGDTGRNLLIVKDSFGNAVAPCLINSFDEVHVVDFRYFPHNLIDYVDDNGITDLVFVNCPSLAFSQNAANRFYKMLRKFSEPEAEEIIEEESDEES